MTVLMHWGDRWEAGPEGGPVVVRHRDCGEPVHVELRWGLFSSFKGPSTIAQSGQLRAIEYR